MIARFSKQRFKNFIADIWKRNLASRPLNQLTTKVYEKHFSVKPRFGKLILHGNFSCCIEPADVQLYSDANHASVTLWSGEKHDLSSQIEIEFLDEDILKVELLPAPQCDVECKIQLPIKYDIDAKMYGDASLEIRSMESDFVEINSRNGDIVSYNLKSRNISILKNDGCILGKGLLLGNINISAGNITFSAGRLQGSEMMIQAKSLEASIQSSYINNSHLFAEGGILSLKHLHGSTSFHLKNGNLKINSLSGSLNASIDKGEADVGINELHEDSSIEIGQGRLRLSVQDPAKQNIDLASKSLDISSDLDGMGNLTCKNGRFCYKNEVKSRPLLIASVAEGSASLSLSDWVSSLGIKGTNL